MKKHSEELLKSFQSSMLQEGYATRDSDYESGLYGVYLNDTLLVTVLKNGGLGREVSSGLDEVQQQIIKVYTQMREAYALYEKATPLPFESITDYRLVSEYGDSLLAAKMTKDNEVHFTTWDYDSDHGGVNTGHYYATNYEGAKQDFAIRAGLVNRDKLFDKEELASIYDACVFRGVNDGEITYDDEKLLRNVMEKVEENLPKVVKQEHEKEHEMEMEV